MIAYLKQKIKASRSLTDFTNAVFFGLLSILFGYVKIKIPDFEGVSADFREIPLLIAIFYLRSIWPIAIMCLITILTPSAVPTLTVYFMHFIALIFAWVSYHRFTNIFRLGWRRAITWVFISSGYYFIFIIPLLLVFNQWLMPAEGYDFVMKYVKMIVLIKYEFIVTALVSTMYLLQLDTREKLIEHEMTLENQVVERTQELDSANEQLQRMNDNLDDLVIQRSMRIKEQLQTINKYAQMNSHELRAPLSNILGLVDLLKKNNGEIGQEVLIDKLDLSAEKLDGIIRQMNTLLETEIKLPTNRLDD